MTQSCSSLLRMQACDPLSLFPIFLPCSHNIFSIFRFPILNFRRSGQIYRKYWNVQYWPRYIQQTGVSREIVIVENIRMVRLLDLTADFGVKTNAKLKPIFKLRVKSKTDIQSCLYTVTLTPKIPDHKTQARYRFL